MSGLFISRGEKGFDTDGFSHAGNQILCRKIIFLCSDVLSKDVQITKINLNPTRAERIIKESLMEPLFKGEGLKNWKSPPRTEKLLTVTLRF